MDYESYEQEIDLKDMFFYALHNWRSILLAGLIFAAIFGGIKYWKASMADRTLQEDINNGIVDKISSDEIDNKEEEIIEQSKKILDLNIQIKNIQKNITANNVSISGQQNVISYNNDLIDYNRTLLKEAEYYLDNSVLLNVAENRPIARKTYQIVLEGDNQYQYYRDPVDVVIAFYRKPRVAQKELSELAEKYSMKQEFFEELYNVDNDYTGNTLTVTASGIDRQMAEEILETVCRVIERDGKKCIVPHTLIPGGKEYYQIKDKDLIDSRRNYTNTILDYKNNINNYKNAIDSANSTIISLQIDNDLAYEQIDVIKAEKKIYEDKKTVSSKQIDILKTDLSFEINNSGLKTIIKYIFLGFLAGVALAFIFYLVLYVLKPVLHMPEDIKSVYGFPILGVFNKKVSGGTCEIDKWIMKAERREERPCDDEVIKTAAVSIANLAESGSKVALFTTLKPNQLIEIIRTQLSMELPDLDIILLSEGVSKASNVDELSHCDGIILLEERNETSMNRFSANVDQIRLFNKKVLGAIIM